MLHCHQKDKRGVLRSIWLSFGEQQAIQQVIQQLVSQGNLLLHVAKQANQDDEAKEDDKPVDTKADIQAGFDITKKTHIISEVPWNPSECHHCPKPVLLASKTKLEIAIPIDDSKSMFIKNHNDLVNRLLENDPKEPFANKGEKGESSAQSGNSWPSKKQPSS